MGFSGQGPRSPSPDPSGFFCLLGGIQAQVTSVEEAISRCRNGRGVDKHGHGLRKPDQKRTSGAVVCQVEPAHEAMYTKPHATTHLAAM